MPLKSQVVSYIINITYDSGSFNTNTQMEKFKDGHTSKLKSKQDFALLFLKNYFVI